MEQVTKTATEVNKEADMEVVMEAATAVAMEDIGSRTLRKLARDITERT